ncbi:UNVERIFIED_CONTAM: 3-demethylubiquinone-9 3-O-methyltransferase, partial [Salmonella enterica subsp. enterica serovar Weltevreden]
WDPRGEMGPLHSINPPRVRYIEQCAGGLAGKKALDVGCGGGILTEALAAKGAQALGIDMAEDVLEVARLHALGTGAKVEYRQTPAETLAAEQPGAYDLVCCMEMLE